VQHKQTYEERVKATRARFIDSLPVRLELISTTLRTEDSSHELESKTRKVHRMLHDIAGNAAMLELVHIEASIRKGLSIAEAADHERTTLSQRDIDQIDSVLGETAKIVTRRQEDN